LPSHLPDKSWAKMGTPVEGVGGNKIPEEVACSLPKELLGQCCTTSKEDEAAQICFQNAESVENAG
jgi:hypothetical protein